MGILSALQSDPRGTIIILLYQIPAILIALTLHELSHGYVAYRCGDPTAQMMGRLSFNPLKHLDPIGTLCMIFFKIGWAKPVPVNPRNYRHYRRDDLLVSLAGIVMNFCLFFIAMLAITGVNELLWKPELWKLGKISPTLELLNRRDFLSFDGFNFYSINYGENVLFYASAGTNSGYVLGTGSDTFLYYLRTPWLIYVQRFLMYFARINLSLAVFNLIPIPPLDGYHVVNDIFLRGKLHIPARVMNFIMIGMMALFFFTSFFTSFISTAVNFVQGGVLNAILWVFGLG